MSTFYAGLDLGQSQDHTALTIVEQLEQDVGDPYEVTDEYLTTRRDPTTGMPVRETEQRTHTEQDTEKVYHLRHAHRYELGTRYTEIVQHVTHDLLKREPLKGNTELVIDATGVGRPVVDMFKDEGLSPASVYITGGDSVSKDGSEYRVPKRDLASTVQAFLQSGRLLFAEQLPFREVLREELQKFKAKINISTGNATFEHWRERDTDDLVLSLAIALWYAKETDVSLYIAWIESPW